MKKIALTLLTLGICLTSLGQPSQAGWDVMNNSDTEIYVTDQPGKSTLWVPAHYNVKIPGFPLAPNTQLGVQICYGDEGWGGCYIYQNPPDTVSATICYTNSPPPGVSGLITVTGKCSPGLLPNTCTELPTVNVFRPC